MSKRMAYGVTIQEEEGGLFLMLTISGGNAKHHGTAIFLSDHQVEEICRGEMSLRLEYVPAEEDSSPTPNALSWGGPRVYDVASHGDHSTAADGTE